jgi:uncharacterized membrane protein YfcA
MFFPISGIQINPAYLIVCGFVIGVLGGFFGVGGSFLASPALFAAGLPMNFVVGTDLAHIVGKSIVAARKHRALGNIDLKLAAVMVIGTIVGSEMGVQAIELLKKAADVTLVVGVVSIIVFTGISLFSAWESWLTLRLPGNPKAASAATEDTLAFDFFSRAIQRLKIPPMISLPHSGIISISLWAVLFVSLVGGLFSGFLGGGAGYIRMPSMVYLLGIPTHIAVGTDLFEIIISASYGTVRHAMNGNVDILIALVMQTGASVGAQIGANLTQYFKGPHIRFAFAPLPLLGAIVIACGLIAGHHH